MGAHKRQDIMDREYRRQWEDAERQEAEYFESLRPLEDEDPGDQQQETIYEQRHIKPNNNGTRK